MAHVMKHTRATCGHMFKHYERAKDADGAYIKIGNQDVDQARSCLNYNLAPAHQHGQGDFVRQRCAEVRMQNRKDVNVMCSWVVTAPKGLPDYEHRTFFQASYEFLQQRYGQKNIVSAYVHMDETTPHMHFAFVPVVKDKKKGGYKVSAKEAVNRMDLQTFHRDLDAHMTKVFGRDIGILNEATKDGNKEIAKLKQETALEATRAAEEASRIAQNRLNEIMALLSEEELKSLNTQPKRFSGGFKGLTVDQAHRLKNTCEELYTANAKLEAHCKELNSQLAILRESQQKVEMEAQNKVSETKREMEALQLKQLTEVNDLKRSLRALCQKVGIPKGTKIADIPRLLNGTVDRKMDLQL